MGNRPVIAIVGPTASGKTRRAVSLSEALGGEIISADSRQLYRGMDIGTGKDLSEYGSVPYHLIDIYPAGYRSDLHQWLQAAQRAHEEITSRGRQTIVCGGTGLYVETFLAGIRLPEVPPDYELRESLAGKSLEELTCILSKMKTLHNSTDVDTTKRAIRAIEICKYYEDHPDLAEATKPHPLDAVIIGVDIDRESRRSRITRRLHDRLDREDMIGEIRRLLDSGISPDDLIYYGLEYRFVTLHLLGQLTREEMFAQLEIAIHQFAKRQMTWLRGMERRGFKINWLPHDMPDEVFTDRAIKLIQSR